MYYIMYIVNYESLIAKYNILKRIGILANEWLEQ